jgi:hypothetical protein
MDCPSLMKWSVEWLGAAVEIVGGNGTSDRVKTGAVVVNSYNMTSFDIGREKT